MNDPGIGARIAGRVVGAIPRDAKTIWGELGPDWLTPDSDEKLPVVSIAATILIGLMEQVHYRVARGHSSFAKATIVGRD